MYNDMQKTLNGYYCKFLGNISLKLIKKKNQDLFNLSYINLFQDSQTVLWKSC